MNHLDRLAAEIFAGPNAHEYREVLKHDPCAYCGRHVARWAPNEIDHIEPKSLGGSNSWENYTGACRDCNRNKVALSLLEILSDRDLGLPTYYRRHEVALRERDVEQAKTALERFVMHGRLSAPDGPATLAARVAARDRALGALERAQRAVGHPCFAAERT